MNNDLSEIYQAIILDHNKNPRNARSMSSPTHIATGYNPLCGDEIKVYILINKNHIFDISFISEGCAISKASASLMTLAVKNENLISVNNKIKEFNNLFNTKKENFIFLKDGVISLLFKSSFASSASEFAFNFSGLKFSLKTFSLAETLDSIT